ncbi:MAG TPA: hypothetical protein VML96_01305 [Egibacteraceae bacterium]|nr:hypothetical protein [Egibacteraceae bacterium]
MVVSIEIEREALVAETVDEALRESSATRPRRPSRRRFVVALGAASLAAGLFTAGSISGSVSAQLLVVRTAEGATALQARTGEVLVQAQGGVPSPDGGVIVRAASGASRTLVTAVDSASGEQRWSAAAGPGLAVRLVGAGGSAAVLGPADDATLTPYAPRPRAQTQLVVARAGGATRAYDLSGNYEPEALSSDGMSLFVISYLPAMAPDRYQVRRVDLLTGAVEEVFTPDEELQQEMGGTARTQAFSADGRRLYTLYTLDAGDGARSAFIHVLDLDELWAHCIDLPDGIGSAEEAAVALAVSPDGKQVYVADRARGLLAELDTRRLSMARVTEIPPVDPRVTDIAGTAAAVAENGRLLLGAGGRIDVIDTRTLTHESSWATPSQIAALVPVGDGELTAVVLTSGRAALRATSTGARLRTYEIPGGPVGPAGSALTAPDDGEPLLCAC